MALSNAWQNNKAGIARRTTMLAVSLYLGQHALALAQDSVSDSRSDEAIEFTSSSSWVTVVNEVAPAVVVIETDENQGSGFVVEADGTIVTNYHVVQNTKRIRIVLASGEVFNRAHVLLADQSRDLAILRVEGFGLPVARLGNSNTVEVGMEVLALGAPRGLGETASDGIASGVRIVNGTRVIQTTAAASPGSSGGPLVDPFLPMARTDQA